MASWSWSSICFSPSRSQTWCFLCQYSLPCCCSIVSTCNFKWSHTLLYLYLISLSSTIFFLGCILSLIPISILSLFHFWIFISCFQNTSILIFNCILWWFLLFSITFYCNYFFLFCMVTPISYVLHIVVLYLILASSSWGYSTTIQSNYCPILQNFILLYNILAMSSYIPSLIFKELNYLIHYYFYFMED